MATDRADIYHRIVAQIIAAIEAGAGSEQWRMPWHHDGTSASRPVNVVSGKRYRGANTLALWAAAEAGGYTSGVWGTYRQWAAKGAQVRRGQRSTPIVFWKPAGDRDDAVAGTNGDHAAQRLFTRSYNVFNRAQVDDFDEPAAPMLPVSDRLHHAEVFFDSLGVPILYGADSAFYRIAEDRIYMPAFSRFHSSAGFYGTLAHEEAHATGAAHRLDRKFEGRWDQHKRGLEEAVAELTAALVLADLSIAHEPRRDHAIYVGHWLDALRDDPRAIFAAASRAQAAADWMHAQQPTSQVE